MIAKILYLLVTSLSYSHAEPVQIKNATNLNFNGVVQKKVDIPTYNEETRVSNELS